MKVIIHINECVFLPIMKQTPETLEIIIAFLAHAIDIRERERGFYVLPSDEQTPEREDELRKDLQRRVAVLSEQYGTKLKSMPEGQYLERLTTRYAAHDMTVDLFIDTYHLTTRTANNLVYLEMYGSRKAGIPKIKTPRDLLRYDAKQLLRIKSFGIITLLELDRAFEQEGWHIQGIERYREKYRI